ncbi:6-phosphofructokinase [Balneicella halophila]|uniref:ATP-dependent 6-phosphofructokinase n=1 Tax=Balneicella halophila TaxID=1537566 RepID=A0A7L4UQT8_BALHA|nr:6-phosphofructokinase [Balneicella halophila]PVX52113.1 6-phosphofructokinase [Balneicella halophila]
MKEIKKIGVLTSGGDAPGMNAAVRAVTRTAIYNGLKVVGIHEGYQGLLQKDTFELGSRTVGHLIQRGGTLLRSARCKEFETAEGRKKAYDYIQEIGLDGLVVIGGDGTFTGASIFSDEYNIPVIGIPATIDNDIFGTDATIGFDTALNTIVEAVDKIRDTASAHNRLFLIEVMGRDAGFIALRAGIATGAESILLPEFEEYQTKLREYLEQKHKRSKQNGIIIVSEGSKIKAYDIYKEITKEHPEYDVRLSILGHLQRGGSPSAYDRVIASQLGVAAVEALLTDRSNEMVGIRNNQVVYVPLSDSIKEDKALNKNLLRIVDILSI